MGPDAPPPLRPSALLAGHRVRWTARDFGPQELGARDCRGRGGVWPDLITFSANSGP